MTTELLTNCVRHAGLDDGEEIVLEVAVLPEVLRVEVIDHGLGFDPVDVTPPEPGHAAAGGWGLWLVNELADRWGVEFGRNTTGLVGVRYGSGLTGATLSAATCGDSDASSPFSWSPQEEEAGLELHMQKQRGSPESPNAVISDAAVRLLREYTGRGPTAARTTINHDSVLIVLRDTLTKGERVLADKGRADRVMQVRHDFQMVMREELVGAVEDALDRRVIAFMSTNHVDPDLAAEIFVLEPPGCVSARDPRRHDSPRPAPQALGPLRLRVRRPRARAEQRRDGER